MGHDSGSLKRFDLEPGRTLAGKYRVGELLGRGWEGEVYYVTETATGVERAAKLFYPERNPGNRTLARYARKLEKLRDCPVIIRYHTHDTFRFRGRTIAFLVSEYVEGELLPQFLARRRGNRLHYFEGVHLLHAMAAGLEQIHERGEYHGDMHHHNVIVQAVGLDMHVKLLDFYHWGRRTAECVQEDIRDAIRIFHDAIGGRRHYRYHPDEIKHICRGLKHGLIRQRFRTAGHLRRHIEGIEW